MAAYVAETGERLFVKDILGVLDLIISIQVLERFSNECRKTKTKVITLANQKGQRQSSKPIKTRSNYT